MTISSRTYQVVSMSACGLQDPDSNPPLVQVLNDAFFFLSVFMIQFNPVYQKNWPFPVIKLNSN